jgi:UDP-3-O-[3-hydroxymyristoyl] glucosamine N-acyltransferase
MLVSAVTTGQLAAFLHGRLIGPADRQLQNAAGIKEAGPSDVSFVNSDAAVKEAIDSSAGALLVHRHIEEIRCPQIVVPQPALAMTKVVANFFVTSPPLKGLSNLCHLGKDVTLGEQVSIWPFVTVDDDVRVGRGTQLYPGVFVGRGSRIGADCLIYPNVTIREDVTIGDRVIIHAGSVIGSDGFGYLQEGGRHHKIPQIGTVVIEDDVEIGANVTVDRATYGKTVIRRGTKLDNLVQIAHNVEIGEDNIIVAQVGVAGSTKTGRHVMVGGQAGITDHVSIGDKVMIAARTGVHRNVAPHEIVSGFPAMSHKTWLRAMVVIPKLPELRAQLHELVSRFEKMEQAALSSRPKPRAKSPRRKR